MKTQASAVRHPHCRRYPGTPLALGMVLASLALGASALCGASPSQSGGEAPRQDRRAAAAASDKAQQLKRDAQGLGEIKTIAVLPVLAQLAFEHDNRIPDPNGMTQRFAVATRLPAIIESDLKGSKYALLPAEAGALALKENNLQPIDLYLSQSTSTWESPAETLRNKSKDECLLLTSLDAMKKAPEQITSFRFTWHNLPAIMTGLAGYKVDAGAKLDPDKVKALGAKLTADAMLIVRITNLEMHRSGNGSIAMPFRTRARVDLDLTLVSTSSGAVLWEARAHGTKSDRARAWSMGSPEDRKAIECAVGALEVLVDDLLNGTGVPVT